MTYAITILCDDVIDDEYHCEANNHLMHQNDIEALLINDRVHYDSYHFYYEIFHDDKNVLRQYWQKITGIASDPVFFDTNAPEHENDHYYDTVFGKKNVAA